MKYIVYIIMALAQSLPPQNATDHANVDLDWCENRNLVWFDFRAKPDFDSHYSALSATYIEESHVCSEAGHFKYSVKAVFAKNQSWVTMTADSALLMHERTHFDLTEYYARKLRKKFSDLSNPCQIPQEEMAAIIDSVYNELEITHRIYDQYTLHGLNDENQQIWNDIVKRCLIELGDYTCDSKAIVQKL